MTTISERNYLGDLLKYELENHQSREKVTILSGLSLQMGAVIGKITKAIPFAGAADPENTGNGTMTGVVGGSATKIGVYELECISAVQDAGAFKVIDPDGVRLEDASVGVAYGNNHLGFTINDGDADFAVGDKFSIAVTEGSGKVREIDFDAVDGSQDAYGFVIADYDASAGDLAGVAIVRDSQIVDSNLVWPDGATSGEKAAAIAQLEARGIVTRQDA